MQTYFAPGCAMMLYNEPLARRIHNFLTDTFGEVVFLDRCCQHDWTLTGPGRLIDICPGCHERYLSRFADLEVVTLYELIAGTEGFNYPDYAGRTLTVHDACSTRRIPSVMDAIRTLSERMNMELVEPALTREKGMCCGDSVYGKIPAEDHTVFAQKRAGQLPCEEVVVYCVSCVKNIHHGGKTPRHMAGLLFGEVDMPVGLVEPDAWHQSIRAYKEGLLAGALSGGPAREE